MSFNKLLMDFRDGVNNDNTLGSGGSNYAPPKWRYGTSLDVNLGSTGGTTNYTSAKAVGIYDYQPQGRNDNVFVSLIMPSDLPMNTYYLFVYASTYSSSDRIGIKKNSESVSLITIGGSAAWKPLGTMSLKGLDELRFSLGVTAGGGTNLATLAVMPTNTAPGTIPSGNNGTVKDYSVAKYLYEDGTTIKYYSPPATGGKINISAGMLTASQQGHGAVQDAFDGSLSSSWAQDLCTLPMWTKINLGAPKIVGRIKIKSYAVSGWESIKDWKLYGSNTGTFSGEEVVVYTGFHPNETTNDLVDYPISSTTAYSHYKLKVTSFHPGNGNNSFQIHEIEIYETILGSGGWEIAGVSPVTAEMFESKGMSSSAIAALTDIEINELSSETPRLLAGFIGGGSGNAPVIKTTAIPHPQVVYPTGDIDLTMVDKIDMISVTSTQSGIGNIRLIASVDSGSTWKSFALSEEITNVQASDLTEVKMKGMTPDRLNALTSEQWSEIIGNSKKIRFAYYLEITALTDTAKTDRIMMQIDMMGLWKKPAMV